jgi:hypothetical protein
MSHNSRIYKVYTNAEVETLDLSLYQTNLRTNNEGTEYILEFIDTPENIDNCLIHSEAYTLMQTDSWVDEFII